MNSILGVCLDFKVPFAYNEDGEVIDPTMATKGVDYKCQCGSPVRLRGGEKTRSHFYHISDSKCNEGETIIHKAYKQVFAEVRSLKTHEGLFQYHDIDIEKRINDGKHFIVADAVGYIGDTAHLIEFAKTSKIGVQKLERLRRINLMTIEILIDTSTRSLEQIRDHLVHQLQHKQIVCRPNEVYEKMIDDRVKQQVKHLTKHLNLDRVHELKHEIAILHSEKRALQTQLDMLQQDIKAYRMKAHDANMQNETWFEEAVSRKGEVYYKSDDKRMVAFMHGKRFVVLKNKMMSRR